MAASDYRKKSMARSEPPQPHTQTRRVVFRGLGVSVVDFRCRAEVEPLGSEEPNPTHSIVFVRRGLFTCTDHKHTLVADANHILFLNQGQPYRYAHPLAGGDDCTILALDDECAHLAVGRFAKPGRPHGQSPFPAGHALVAPKTSWLHHKLLAMVFSGGPESDLAAQDTVAELIDESIMALHRTTTVTVRESAAARARRQEIVEATKLIISRSLSHLPSLEALAASVHCSPFHLSRIFRRTTGLALRQYIRQLRTRLAAEQLRRGHPDLTSLALDLGFCDHSHFTNTFRREWGISPSRLRIK
jgi:AraC-like DNA-binding protein